MSPLSEPGHDLQALGRQAMALHQTGRLDEAETLYRRIIAADPNLFPALCLLGALRLERGDSADAAALIGRALALNPHDPQAQAQYGMALIGQARFADAVTAFDHALSLQPGHLLARAGRGAAWRGLGRTSEALADYDAVVAADPQSPDAWCGRGALLRKLGRIEEALESFNRALALWPDFAEALQGRGELLWDEKQDYPRALADLERAIALEPARPALFGNLLHLKLMMAHEACDFARAEALAAEIPGLIAQGRIVPPWMLLLCSDDEQLQLRNARHLIATRFPAAAPLWTGTRYHHDRIRLAYISSDFNAHAVAGQVVELIERHDRSRFEILAISTGVDDGGVLRRRLIAAFDAFHDVSGLGAPAIAERIRGLEVDLLVDLNGHTQHDNFEVLRLRPSPAQASWLGYAGTTGAAFVDALIADAMVAPDPSAFSERLYLLPDTVLCADTSRKLGETPNRTDAGLPQNAFVFCAFNRNWKITGALLDGWLRILKAVPDSVLWLKQVSADAQRNLAVRAALQGVNAARLIYAAPLPLEDHLARHALADLFLDTMPYCGHVTACDALWSGLPVLTLKSHAYAGRVSASLLAAVGLPELITESPEEYEAFAIALARDPARLKDLRDRLARNRATAPLFNTERFARNIEEIYARILADRLNG
ncbi:MAG TPA: tetratricopeptide repeat protein [Rhizomicrobium sp.]|nr:tetratricopeptide repeat protein [Rhizomicrobium sp.]